MKEKLFLCVTADEFELPMFVGSLKEMSDFLGISENGIYCNISHGCKTKVGGERCRIIRITA